MTLFTLFFATFLCSHSDSAGQALASMAESRPRFEDFRVGDVFQGRHPKIVWPDGFDPSEPAHDRLVFAAQSTVQKKPNFAGHYGIAEYSCGTNCAELVIVDLKSGAVLENSPYTTIESHFDSKKGASYEGISFRRQSRLLIASGCFDWDVPTSSRECGTKYFEFKNAKFVLLQFIPGPIPEYLKSRR
ncbi:MAG TPA: hypothetical protein VKT53_12760 [Candidatus Acidoferrum sp.]|nr:hypothetical protein [Candidatus Acidoferrum sp.]